MNPQDAPKPLEILRSELQLIENSRSKGSPLSTPDGCSLCQASITCLMCYGEPNLTCPLAGCVLLTFVPPEHRSEGVPCHHIPLTAAGEGIEELEGWCTPEELEVFVKIWLRKTIQESEKKATSSVGDRASPDVLSHTPARESLATASLGPC